MTKYEYITRTLTHHGKRYYVRGKTLEECLQKRIELKSRLAEGDRIKYTPTVAEWTKTALNDFKPNVSEDYRSQMTQRVGKHILSEIGDMKVQDVTVLDCQRIINNQAGKSKSHIRKLTQELKFIFGTARKNGLIKNNPADDIEPPTGTEGKRRSLTQNERYHFLKVTESDPQYLIFRIMLFCGLRSSEAWRVEYSDIVTMQGVKFFHVRGTKTASADRMVPIPPELDLGEGEGVIARDPQGKPYTKNSYRCAADRLRRDMNISMGCKVRRNQLIPPLPLAEDFTPYMLRHTFCTDLKKKGVDIRLARDMMGHADIKITAGIYDHADDESAILAAVQMGLIANNVANSENVTE